MGRRLRNRRREPRMVSRSAILAAGLVGLPLAGAAAPPPGAAACSGCHAPPGAASSVPAILGRDPDEVSAAMQDFRSGRRPATVMDRIARGFSEDETRAIAVWLAEQPQR